MNIGKSVSLSKKTTLKEILYSLGCLYCVIKQFRELYKVYVLGWTLILTFEFLSRRPLKLFHLVKKNCVKVELDRTTKRRGTSNLKFLS